MKISRLVSLGFGLLFCVGLSLQAQSVNPPGNPGNVDSEWRSLNGRALPPSARAPAGTAPRGAAQQAQERQEQLTHFLAIAEEARIFGRDHADHAQVAQVLEAKSLLKAAFLGDDSREARRQALVSEIEGDKTLPTKDRFEVVAMAEHLLLRELAKDALQARLTREESARYLMKEFPEERGGYAALLGAADIAGDRAQVLAVAREVLDSPAPFAAKAEARVLTGRYELIGKSLADVANTALGRDNWFEKTRGRQVLLYTWATWSQRSIAYAKELGVRVPPGVLIIGYNLDRDAAGARAVAAREALPGEHYYNAGGVGAWPALLLKLNSAPLVYVTDEKGLIREVAAQRSKIETLFPAVSGR